MTRYEQTQFFETICHLRATYADRSDADRRSVVSIEDSIAYAEAIMFAITADDEEERAFDEIEALAGEALTVFNDTRN